MKLLVFDFPGVTGQQYDELCRSLNHGAPLRTLAEFRSAGYPVVAYIAGPPRTAAGGSWTCGSPTKRSSSSGTS
jgi:hypothetical protein